MVESRTALIEQQKVSLSSKCLLGRRRRGRRKREKEEKKEMEEEMEEEEEEEDKAEDYELVVEMVIDNLADEMIQNKAALIEQQKDSHFSECSLRRRNRKTR